MDKCAYTYTQIFILNKVPTNPIIKPDEYTQMKRVWGCGVRGRQLSGWSLDNCSTTESVYFFHAKF